MLFLHRLSVRTKLVCLFLCLNLLTVLSFSIHTYLQSSEQAVALIDSRLNAAARAVPTLLGEAFFFLNVYRGQCKQGANGRKCS
ncbi:hypothetical protein [Iodobacter sp. BJB302]|uniref:hypothetical protein n=1 Tax=Iodobacter sp. BJB302 TaxID=1506510 RepID=UPI0015D4E08F|nr:hypothetical protein [Iodobacter sp. BJB302]